MKVYVELPPWIRSLVADKPLSVLLETTRFDAVNCHSYVFLEPLRTIVALRTEDVEDCLLQVQDATASGLFVAGYIAYEAGYALQGLVDDRVAPDGPLLWLGVYAEPTVFDHVRGTFAGAPLPYCSVEPLLAVEALLEGEFTICLSAERHAAKIEQIKERIAAGATYQINLTDRVDMFSAGPTADIYSDLARRQPVSYAALIHTGAMQILSFSPELFFRVQGGEIATRPMKGTWPRGRDAAEDVLAAIELQNDEKNRSEHLMIVDLLRNDLGRLCEIGSVHVDEMFSVERYPSLLQMTSIVSGTLRCDTSWLAIFRSLFPSGSVTGAPKISSMKIIRELEDAPRGVYTGAIGYFGPGGNAVFNVAIRTLVQRDNRLSMGVGGDIVADSDAAEEFSECALKAAFLKPTRKIDLIETMRWDGGYARLDRHMERLQRSCEYFGFALDAERLMVHLHELATTFQPLTQHRVRLTLDQTGKTGITSARLEASAKICRVSLSTKTTIAGDLYLRHKTTQREVYESEFASARQMGFDEVLFFNERGELTEGAISNVFLRIDEVLCTPPIECGVLPGVFRRHLLETLPAAEERVLMLQDLEEAKEIYLCNSVRGLRRVTSLQIDLPGGMSERLQQI